MFRDTIAAISTPLGGESGIGVIRISGPQALIVLNLIFKPSNKGEFHGQEVRNGWIIDDSCDIDQVMVTYMKTPNSYTGEDVVEISCHGNSLLLKQVLNLSIKAGARAAQRGEFTKRAFINGKIDLTQAEAVIDLIKARTSVGSRLAASQLKGQLSTKIRQIRDSLMHLIAETEASIDFPDEIMDIDIKSARHTIDSSLTSIEHLLKTADLGKIFREGVSIAIIGRPNVGKSSILNALVREERAIVSEDPGTTRDVIEESINLQGIPVKISDTAGIRQSGNRVEQLGVERAHQAIKNADMALLILDISEALSPGDKELLDATKGTERIIVLNKADKGPILNEKSLYGMAMLSEPIKVSALHGTGIDLLEKAIYEALTLNNVVADNPEVMINLRHKESLIRARESLLRALESISRGMASDFISIDLKGAIAALGELTGEAVSEEVITRIFEEFCVGK